MSASTLAFPKTVSREEWLKARGLEPMLGTYHLPDLTAFGRQEGWEDSPAGWPQTPMKGGNDWVRHHDKYGDEIKGSESCCHT